MWPTSIAVWKPSDPPQIGQRVAVHRLPDVCESRREVAAVLDSAEVPAGAVRAGDELPIAKRIVGDDLTFEADGAERAGIGAERVADLRLGGRS